MSGPSAPDLDRHFRREPVGRTVEAARPSKTLRTVHLPVHAGSGGRGPGGTRVRHRPCLRPARVPELSARRSSPTPPSGRIAGRSARLPPTPEPIRPCSASSRAASIRSSGRRRRGSSRACRSMASASAASPATRRGSARRDARRRRAAPRRRPAAALPDGPRVAGGPARGGPPGRRPVRFRPAGSRRPERPAVGARRPPQHPQPALPRRPGPGPGGLSVPRSAGGSRGPISPICSGPRSCSRTVSRLVTT